MIEQIGNYVKINDVMIPAANIQVENVPGYLDNGDGTRSWYGVYFEVAFEHGELWAVMQGNDPEYPCHITIHRYANWVNDKENYHKSTLISDDEPFWDFFLFRYRQALSI